MARRRGSIREFQETLARKLAAQAQATPARWLLAQAGQSTYALPLAQTAGVVHEFQVAPVPWAPAAYRGVANVRGDLYDVIDLAAAVGIERTPVTQNARLVLLATQVANRCALLVRQVIGLRHDEDLLQDKSWQDRQTGRQVSSLDVTEVLTRAAAQFEENRS